MSMVYRCFCCSATHQAVSLTWQFNWRLSWLANRSSTMWNKSSFRT